MEQQGNTSTQGMGMPFSMNPYQPNPMATGPTQPAAQDGSTEPIAFQQHEQQLQQQLLAFWARQREEVEHTTDFKNRRIPLARIKKIMKSNEDVRMISSEAPVVFAKACEMFIQELTLRAWNKTEEKRRRTLQRNDLVDAIPETDIFDFLVDIVPQEDVNDDASGSGDGGGLLPPVMPPQMGAPSGIFVDPTVYGPAFVAPQPPPPSS